MKTSKKLNKLIALAVLLGGVTYSGSVWAGEIKIKSDSQPDPSTYSTTIGVGVDATAQNRSLGTNVDKILTVSGGVAVAVYGIKTENSYGVTADSISNGIDVKSTSDNAYAIFLEGTGTNTISGLGSIIATSTAQNNKFVNSINMKNTNTAGAANPEFSVSFVTTGGSISAYSASGFNCGINFLAYSTGTSEVKNVKTITAGVSDSNVSTGNAYGILAQAGVNTVTFTGADSSITAKSSDKTVYGIYCVGGSNTIGKIVDTKDYRLGSITATTSATDKKAHGIYSNGSYDSFASNVSFVTSGGTINATNTGNAYGISAINKGTTTVSNLGSITAESTGDTGTDINAYGIYMKNTNAAGEAADPATFSVTMTNGNISAYSASGENYGILFDTGSTGTSEVKNVKTIKAKTDADLKKAYGIQAKAGVNKVEFIGADSSIKAESKTAGGIGIQLTGGENTIGTTEHALENIVVLNGGSSGASYGISVEGGTNMINFASTSSVSVSSDGDNAYGVKIAGIGTTVINNLASIAVNLESDNAYGISMKNNNAACTKAGDPKFSISMANGSISAYSEDNISYGIEFADESIGTSEVLNVKSITAGITKNEQQQEVIGEGAAYGVRAKDGVNTVTFTGADSSITAKSSGGNAFGIQLEAGTNTVSNLRSVSVVTNVSDNGEYGAEGVYLWDEGINTVTFTGADSSIAVTATGTSAKAYGIDLEENGQNTVSGLGSITAKTNGNKVAYGIRLYNQNDAGGSIPEFLVEFATDEQKTIGGSIDVYSQTGENYGIKFDTDSTGTSEVKNVKTITAGVSGNNVTVGTPYGIYAAAGVNTVTFTGADSSITAKSNMYQVYGLHLSGGTNNISDIGSIKTNSTGSAMAYGIYTTGGKNTISFKGNSETPTQAITAKGSDALTSCSISTTGGSTTVNFENSILSGKVKQSGDSTLTMNFNDGGVWKPTASDVTGNVNVNVNAGGTIDTRATTTATKTINLGTGTFTATPKTEVETTIYPLISFDAWAKSDNTLVIDQVTAAAANGTIKLGTVNVKDEATAAWTTAKEANLFSVTANLITITGEAKTETSQGWLYTFKGGANGKVSVTSELASHTLPQIIQGSDAAAQYTNTYSLTANVTLGEDLGTLNNEKRTDGLTISGNGKTLSKGTATNGTVTLAQATDILTLQDVTVSGFTKFADNAGTLNLSGVTFTGTTGNDVITGTGKTVISGVVTADKNIAQQVELQNGANLTATGISVDSTGEVKGIYAGEGVNTVTFTGTDSSITAKSSGSYAYGITSQGNATTNISGLSSITAEGSMDARGIFSNGDAANVINFNVEVGGTINAKSTGMHAYGIYAINNGTTTVSGLGSITAETTGSSTVAYGINVNNKNVASEAGTPATFSISFVDAGGSISAYSASGDSRGINFETGSTGTSEVKNVKTITAGVRSTKDDQQQEVISSGKAYGINAVAGVNTVEFTGGTASSITAKSSGKDANGIYLDGSSTNTISGLGSIMAETTGEAPASAYGIYAKDGENTVQFTEDGGSVFAKSTSTGAVGIKTDDGTNNISNLKSVSVVTSASTGIMSAEGVYLCAGTNTITFTGADSSITVTATGTAADAYGIDSDEDGTNIISNLGSITVETAGSGKSAYGIHMCGVKGANTISFKGNGGQAITAMNTANSANAYSIYAKGGTGTTTVNFENSILSGKIHQEGTATLNLNFNDKGVWKPVNGDVSGNVNVTVKDGGTIDTQNSGSIDSVNLGTGTLTFDSGSQIKIDVLVTATDITIDNFTAGKATGVITLADFNIKENAPTEALGEKSVYLITGDCSGITNYTVAYDVQEVESENYRYSFSLSKDTTGLLLKVTMNGKGVADEIISGKKSTYELKDDETLKKDLGTLDNSKRESNSFTMDGTVSKFDLIANGYKGVTIANPTDVMIVKDMNIKGFDTFATNSGNLTLEYVTFSDEPATAVNDIKNDGTLNVKGDTTFNKGIGGTGTTYIKGGANVVYKSTTPKSITNRVVIETNGKLDPCVSVFAEGVNVEVQNDKSEGSTPGTLILTPGTLYANIKQAEGAILTVKANDLPKGTTFMTGVDKASQLDVGNGTLIIDGAKKWGYYSLVSGKAVTDGTLKLTDLWLVRENVENFRPEYDIDNGVVTLEFRNIPLEVEANTSALAGVQQGAISIVGEIADNIGDNLSTRAKPAEGGKYDKNVWATYINSKDSTDGMSMWRVSGNNDISYRGATVGVDFYTSEKAISGVALTYVTGDVTSNPMDTHINNKIKRYGVSLYNRVANGNNALTYDLGYSQGSNEISENSYQMVTADAKTRAYTLGAKYEYACNFEHSALVPFASVRYLRLNSNDYSNSNGFNTSVNNQNIFQPKLGVAWRGDFKMGENGWSFKPVAEVGYLWNLGGTQADGTFTTVNRSYNIEYDTADRSTFYGKLGMNFQNKNFTAGVFYRYAKGSSVKNNRWNVNMAWAF